MKGDKVEMVDIILPACAVGTADRFNPDNLRLIKILRRYPKLADVVEQKLKEKRYGKKVSNN